KLLPRMIERIDLPRALLRGRFMRAAAVIERRGIPIDVKGLMTLRNSWSNIKGRLVAEVDTDYQVYDGTTFKSGRFARYLEVNNIPWPTLESGALALDRDTFRDAAKSHPKIASLAELRHALSELRLEDLACGSDGRNRTGLWAFSTTSSRNAPSNTKSIFGPSTWLRSLIQPPPGCGLAYVDWSAAEIGIAAALSGDANLMEAYKSGDPYLTFAKQAGAAPPEATKQSHGPVRDLYKTVELGVNYGMGENALAARTGKSVTEARELLR